MPELQELLLRFTKIHSHCLVVALPRCEALPRGLLIPLPCMESVAAGAKPREASQELFRVLPCHNRCACEEKGLPYLAPPLSRGGADFPEGEGRSFVAARLLVLPSYRSRS